MQLFNIYRPTVKALPIVANIPHSGLFVPEDIAAKFTTEHLNSLPNSDWHLDKLYDFLPDLGITVLQATHNRYIEEFGKVYLLDLHSFCGLLDDDVCLGNVNNQTCSQLLISIVEESFTSEGLKVVRKKTFTGGYITKHYGKIPNLESLQIEVRYHVYLQKSQIDKLQPPSYEVIEFEAAKKKFYDIFKMIVSKLF